MTAVFYRLLLVVSTLVAPRLAVADRLVDYVPPSLLHDSPGQTNCVAAHLPATTTQIQTVATLPRPVDAAERWERFETEFGIKQHNNSLMLGSLQNAKYQLDKTTFTMQEWMNDIEESLRFDCGLKDLGLPVPPPKSYRPTRDNSFVDALQGARLKSDINLNVASESYVGVKLVLPLGN